MSLEAIITISQAEENAKRIRQDAQTEARRKIAEAEQAGKAELEAAGAKAADELVELNAKAMEKADAAIAEMFSNVENKKAAMRVHAESNRDKAAMLIVERIVNS